MKKRCIKLSLILVVGFIFCYVFSEDFNLTYSEITAESVKDNVDEKVIEEELEKYTYDENSNITDVVDDIQIDTENNTRSSYRYQYGYLDFLGRSSQVINVYPTATSTNAYTYFNSGSAERVATLGENGNRIRIVISGYDGWIDKSPYITGSNWFSINNLPSNHTEYYTTNASGDLIYNYAYYEGNTSIIIGKSPSFMVPNTKYYSLDGVYYYNNMNSMFSDKYNNKNGSSSLNYNSPYYNYYQYLPFRSTTNLTVNDFQSFLKNRVGTQTSVLNNSSALNQFFISGEAYSINPALEFSMAMLESGYGTSQIAKEKNNIFGWGAVDSGPYQGAYKFPTVDAGIDYHAHTAISIGFLDVTTDTRYFGGHLGNKESGINVKYASDPYWGMKIAGLYYNMDKLAGFKDYNAFMIGVQNKGVSSVNLGNNYIYNLKNVYSNINVNNIPVLVVSKTNSKIEFISDIGICNAGDKAFSYKINSSTLNIDTIYYDCPTNKPFYAAEIDFDRDIVNTSPNAFTFTGSTVPRSPSLGNVYLTEDIKYIYVNGTSIIDYAYKVNSSGKVTNYYEFNKNTTYAERNANLAAVFNVNSNNNYIRDSIHFNSRIEIVKRNVYHQNTKYGNHTSKVNYAFNIEGSTGNLTSGFRYNTYNQVNRMYLYKSGTHYTNHSNNVNYYYNINPTSEVLIEGYRNNSSGKVDRKYLYFKNTHYTKHATNVESYYNVNPNNGTLIDGYIYNSSKKLVNRYVYYANSSHANVNSNIQYKFNISPGTSYLIDGFRLTKNGKVDRRYTYNSSTHYTNHSSNLAYYFNINPNNETLIEGFRMNYAKKVDRRYTYNSSTHYTNHSSNLAYYFNINPNNETLIEGFRMNYAKKADRRYTYRSGTHYTNHSSNLAYYFNINPNNETLIEGFRMDYAKKADRRYTYRSNTNYRNHQKNVAFVFNLHSGSSTLKDAYRVNSSGKIDRWYTYNNNTYYTEHSKNVKYVYNVDKNGYLIDGYRLNSSKKIDRWYNYSVNTTYSNKSGRITQLYNVNTSNNYISSAYVVDSNFNIIGRIVLKPNTRYEDRIKNQIRIEYY